MKYPAQCVFFLCLIFCLLFIGCASKSTATSETNFKVQKSLSFDNYCQEWQQIFNELNEEEKESLQIEGISYANKNPFILSEDLVEDCQLRIKIGRFIWNGMREEISETEKNFANQNSKEIVRVIDHIWNSSNFSVDGVTHEKYLLLLSDKGIKDEDIAPFIGKLIVKEKINSEESEDEVFYILFNRPLPTLNSIILDSLKNAERKKDLLGQIYSAYLLFRDTKEKKFFEKIKAIYKNKKISKAVKIELNNIVAKIERGKFLEYRDFDNLSYAFETGKLLTQN